MDISYLITPFFAWLAAGCTKFIINSIKAKQLAFGLIGYGGLPSNHTAIVTSATALIGFKESIEHPAFGIGVALCFVVMLDANSLRQKVGQQAALINKLNTNKEDQPLRERIGHTKVEIGAGVITGVLCAWVATNLIY